jgi:hypothetical protein
MKNKLIIILVLFVQLLLCSCSKDLCDCLKGTGALTTEERYPGDFNSVRTEDNINLILFRDSACRIIVECGSGIINDIHTEVEDGWLRLWNSSSCNWVRDLDPKINVYVYSSILDTLSYSSYGDVITPDTLTVKRFTLEVRDGSGSIDLKIKADTAYFNQHDGAADVTLSGKVQSQYIYNNGLGPINALGLEASFTYINSRGTNDCFVNATDHLEARIEYIGNIYYSGNPPVLITWILGDGQLLPYDP